MTDDVVGVVDRAIEGSADMGIDEDNIEAEVADSAEDIVDERIDDDNDDIVGGAVEDNGRVDVDVIGTEN